MNSELVDLFFDLDIRVGKIIKVEDFEEAIKPAYKLEIDFGEAIGVKKSSAQITNYSKEDLLDRKVISVINLGEKQVGPFISQCLVLGSITKNNEVLLLSPEPNAELGEKIS
jgi:tRNA-binding protein|tara:strand:+ start:1140 stop:1475 length:336 start_codon:yes stop_codon:yes gene_type:complete